MVKVERSFPAPESLQKEREKANGRYDSEDVLERLSADFHNKCYLCELKPLQDPEVEHLRPHKNGKYLDRKFDWANLFWACGRCNSIKNQRKYDEGIINCCKEDPEAKIRVQYLENAVEISSLEEGNELIDRTVLLLNEVYNKKNSGMRVITSEYRIRELRMEMNLFFDSLSQYNRDRTNQLHCRILKAYLSRESAFAAFKRGYIKDHFTQYPELQSWLE
ncbi:MAG: hypothetical protein IJ153_04655 [Clostridia bacterium]|nr:hypothetical protein [Clostridia bacterium]